MASEDQIVTRSIEVTWGGEQRMLPVLPMGAADSWRQLFAKKFPDNDPSEMDGAAAMSLASGKLLDLLLNYDRSKALGTKEWIKANVTDDELIDAFVEVFRRSFRVARLPLELMPAMLKQAPARSPNGLSPTGTLTPISSASD